MPRLQLALRIVLIAVTAVVALLVVTLLVLRTEWGGRQLARVIEGQVENVLDGEVSIDAIRGDLFRAPSVLGVEITREGKPLIAADRIDLRYDLIGLLTGDLSIESIALTRPVVYLVQGPDGITLFDLLETEDTDPAAPPQPFTIAALTIVDGHVWIGPGVRAQEGVDVPDELRALQARLAIDRDVERTQVAIEALSFVGVAPHLELKQLAGAIRLNENDLFLQQIAVQTGESRFTLDGTIANLMDGGSQ